MPRRSRPQIGRLLGEKNIGKLPLAPFLVRGFHRIIIYPAAADYEGAGWKPRKGFL